jgi:hypothetical protein
MSSEAKPAAPAAFIALADEAEVAKHMQAGAPNPYDFGFTPNMSRLLLAHDEIGPRFRALFAQVMFKPGALSRAERELVAGVAAAAQDCFY